MTNPRGRQAIGVNQPPGSGSLYPFVRPSEDIQELLGDFFVSFDDLADEIAYPLRVAWMYGFGEASVPPPPGWPEPTHSHDLVVLDANDVVVFDSTQADTFQASTWDDRLVLLEWTSADRVCRCTQHTEWTEADTASGQTRSYDEYITPVDGELQADCWYKLPKRVTSIRVGLTTIAKQAVSIGEGYNLALAQLPEQTIPSLDLRSLTAEKTLVPGKRRFNRIELDATPGNGLGVFPGCVGDDTNLRTINRVRSNRHQEFNYDAAGCIRLHRPVSLLGNSPRRFAYAAFEFDTEQARSSIKLNNDCTNCCDCTYFAQTYQGLKRQWFLYRDIAQLAEESRDTYASNRDRWLVQKQIREAQTLRLRVSLDGDGKIRWGASFCNASKCCLVNPRLYLFFVPYVNGTFSSPTKPMFMCGPSYIEGSAQCDGPEPILASQAPGVSNSFRYTWDYADPQSQTMLYGRVCLPDAKDLPDGALKVRVWVGINWADMLPDPATGLTCSIDPVVPTELPPEVEQIWEASGLPSPLVVYGQQFSPFTIVDKNNPFCSRCDCD
jgi:hypothetical protein